MFRLGCHPERACRVEHDRRRASHGWADRREPGELHLGVGHRLTFQEVAQRSRGDLSGGEHETVNRVEKRIQETEGIST